MPTPFSFVVVLLLTALVGYLVVIAAAAVAGAIARGARRERAVDAYEALAVSRFTIPVSVIVPVNDEHAPLSNAITQLLALNYPEYEVIVVCEGVSVAALERVKEERGLEAKEVFYRRSLETAPVQRFYASPSEPRLMIVDKTAAGRADALNCGVNLARYRYVVVIPPAVAFDANALLRLVSPALRDPATVLAVTSSVERRGRSEDVAGTDEGGWTRAAHDYQRLVSLRSWMASCLAWYGQRGGFPPRESIIGWRRDAVLDLGGFSPSATDPDMDMLARLQSTRHERTAGRVVRTSEVFGHAAPTSLGRQAAITVRRRRALFEAMQTFRKAPAMGRDRLTLTLTLMVELLTPAAEGVVLFGVLAAAAAGWVSWTTPLLAASMLAFGTGVVSASALLVRGGASDAPTGRELTRLLLRTPIEFAVYRPALAWARLRNS
jgi:Glycosyl transferase family 2